MLHYYLILSVLTLLIISRCQGEEKNGKPHIVVIVADDLGWNDVSFHGGNQVPTPNIDALAYSGLILNRHYTPPTCTPSRTAFQTGRYSIRAGMQGWPLAAGEARGIPLKTTLLPQYLKNLGYSTRLVGKWHIGYHTKYHTPVYRGFDSFYGYYNGYIEYFNHTITQEGFVGNDLHRDFNHGKRKKSLGAVFEEGYFTDLVTKESVSIIQNHNHSSPLFLQVNHLAVHSSDSEEIMEVCDGNENNKTFDYISDYKRRKFAGVMKALDESVGKIVDSLKKSGMLQNSIVLFMADNGAMTFGLSENYGSNYPLRGLKFSLFEGGVRVPACLYSPLLKNPQKVMNQLVHVTDWLPTLYAAAGGDVGHLANLDGVNQWPIFQDYQPRAILRPSILLNIDEELEEEGAIINSFKLVKGSKPCYSNHSGDSGRDEKNPEYSVEKVMESMTYRAISGLSSDKPAPTAETILHLRNRSDVICNNSVLIAANCSNYCLFDIFKDPCEYQDLSSRFPEVVRELEYFIDAHRSQMIAQTNKKFDPNSNPSNFNGTWMPWLTANVLDKYFHVYFRFQNWITDGFHYYVS